MVFSFSEGRKLFDINDKFYRKMRYNGPRLDCEKQQTKLRQAEEKDFITETEILQKRSTVTAHGFFVFPVVSAAADSLALLTASDLLHLQSC